MFVLIKLPRIFIYNDLLKSLTFALCMYTSEDLILLIETKFSKSYNYCKFYITYMELSNLSTKSVSNPLQILEANFSI